MTAPATGASTDFTAEADNRENPAVYQVPAVAIGSHCDGRCNAPLLRQLEEHQEQSVYHNTTHCIARIGGPTPRKLQF